MPTPAYMSIEGTTQGNLTKGASTEASVGNIYVEGHEDESMVQAVSHNISRARDSQSGQPTGMRVHGPVTITKNFDKASPLILQALTTGEVLTKVTLKHYRTSISGTQEHYVTLEMIDAVITDVQTDMPHCQDASHAHLMLQEHVSFSYRKITWTHVTAGTQASDDWRKPV